MSVDRAFVVCDLGFGDAGKGLLTDHLVRATGARLVVRYNGGAQAGHNVVTPDGRHHTFAQLGAGSFVPAVETYLSRYMLVHPTALLVEAAALESKGVPEPLARCRISEGAPFITPFHQAANRLRELARGEQRHGSCGIGVGETALDALAFPDETVHAADLHQPRMLRHQLRRVQERKRAEMRALGSAWPRQAAGEFEILERADIVELWASRIESLRALIVADDWLASQRGAVVFEGAQGVLLDEDFGFHPHTTWSRCTPANALGLLREQAPPCETTVIGVLRSHAVRHGAGPLPTEITGQTIREHNVENEWQGHVRYGHFDAVLARYALEAAGRIDLLALTHLDTAVREPVWCFAREYRVDNRRIERLAVDAAPSLEGQSAMTRLLTEVRPVVEEEIAEPDHIVARVEELLGRRIGWVSHGPTSGDVAALERTPQTHRKRTWT